MANSSFTMDRLSVADYRIGIVCALAKEMVAVIAMFDERHQPMDEQDERDYNSYALGRIHKHNVAVACLPAGIYGSSAAARVAQGMLWTFSNVRIGLIVGIGGGIPDLRNKSDIRLGDVVVSQPDRTFGGVVQYDLIKHHADGTLEAKGFLDKPPTVLLTALTALQTRHSLEGSKISAYMEQAYQNCPRLVEGGYVLSNDWGDHLHCSHCASQLAPPPRERCCHCVDGLVTRKRRANRGPVVHYGIIASGNRLIKNAEFRDTLKQQFNAKCVEMEAAGMMNDFKCMVIRGVCDYADAYKNDHWQEYAALVAAACAKELLSEVAPAKVDNELPMREVASVFKEQVNLTKQHLQMTQRHFERGEIQYRNESHRQCHQAFKTSLYEEAKNNNPGRAPGTCQWVLDHAVFCRWKKSSKSDLIWISADPGCGKSVLARSLVDGELQHDYEGNVCYYFFKDDGERDNLATALCALLHQLFSHHPELIRLALPAWNKDGPKIANESETLWQILIAAACDAQAARTVCVLDALDECKGVDRAVLIRYLTQFYRSLSRQRTDARSPSLDAESKRGYLKFLVTSRPYDDIQVGFQLPPDLPSIRLRGEDENDQLNAEIDTVIRSRVADLANTLDLKSYTRARIEDKLLAMQNRTYLWLDLAMQDVYETFRDSLRPDEELIDHLPVTVEDAYEKMLSKVRGRKNSETVKLILQIIVGAKRPLTIGEMAIALGIATSPQQPKTLKGAKVDKNHLQKQIRHWCGLFVFINHSKLYLIHQTAKEYLLGERSSHLPANTWKHCLNPVKVEEVMTRICVDFLFLKDVAATGNLLSEKLETSRRPLLAMNEQNDVGLFVVYCAENWGAHSCATTSTSDGTLSPLRVRKLFDDGSDPGKWWLNIYWSMLGRLPRRRPTALGVAAAIGNKRVVELLLHDGQIDVNGSTDGVTTAIMLASTFNHLSVVELLLDAGADTSASGTIGGALLLASANGHKDIVTLLLDRGVDVEGSIPSKCAIYTASQSGYRDVVELLLDRGAKVNGPGGNAFRAAISGGHVPTVELFLDRGININDLENGLSALQEAASIGRSNIVELLLDRGADVNAREGGYARPLSLAVERRARGIAELLLDRGADVGIRGEPHGSVLQEASLGGCYPLAELFLQRGVDVNAHGDHSSALQLASRERHCDVVQLLLDHGAEIITQGPNGSALELAPCRPHRDIARLLLDHGAKIIPKAQRAAPSSLRRNIPTETLLSS